MAEILGESEKQIQRYIRITYLDDENHSGNTLLGMVDEGRIKIKPAVELSYLSEPGQKALYEYLLSHKVRVDEEQAKKLRALDKENETLSEEDIKSVLETTVKKSEDGIMTMKFIQPETIELLKEYNGKENWIYEDLHLGNIVNGMMAETQIYNKETFLKNAISRAIEELREKK